jgi:hypothetical protein
MLMSQVLENESKNDSSTEKVMWLLKREYLRFPKLLAWRASLPGDTTKWAQVRDDCHPASLGTGTEGRQLLLSITSDLWLSYSSYLWPSLLKPQKVSSGHEPARHFI